MPIYADCTYQAIRTKFIPPTNYRGSRVKAECQAMKIIISWDDAINATENHRAACKELCKRMAAKSGRGSLWECPMVGGCLPDGSHCWVFIPNA